LNPDCESHDVKSRVFIVNNRRITKIAKIDNFPIVKDENNKDEEFCPCCQQELKHVGFLGLQIFSKISLMDLNQRKQMMLNRSSAHAKKGEQRDRKAGMDKQVGF
jgi:hypothetical protein